MKDWQTDAPFNAGSDLQAKPTASDGKQKDPRPTGRRRDRTTIAEDVQTRFPKIIARLAE